MVLVLNISIVLAGGNQFWSGQMEWTESPTLVLALGREDTRGKWHQIKCFIVSEN